MSLNTPDIPAEEPSQDLKRNEALRMIAVLSPVLIAGGILWATGNFSSPESEIRPAGPPQPKPSSHTDKDGKRRALQYTQDFPALAPEKVKALFPERFEKAFIADVKFQDRQANEGETTFREAFLKDLTDAIGLAPQQTIRKIIQQQKSFIDPNDRDKSVLAYVIEVETEHAQRKGAKTTALWIVRADGVVQIVMR